MMYCQYFHVDIMVSKVFLYFFFHDISQPLRACVIELKSN